MPKFSFIILVISFLACNNHSALQRRESIMNSYFQASDSLPYADMQEWKFELLKAYHENDTDYLKKSCAEVRMLLNNWRMVPSLSCEDTTSIKNSNFEQAYRFNYHQAFCTKFVTMTIGKSADNITLDLYLYDVSTDRSECNIINHTVKKLNKQDWEDLIKGIYYADFWGLKEINGKSGFDGSDLRVTGYERKVNTFAGRDKTIYRWGAEETAIGQLFKKCLDLSGITVDCFRDF